MIIAEQKPLEEIKRLVGDAQKVLVTGCGTCVTVCFAGGAREAAIVASSLRMSSKLDGVPKEVTDAVVQRQCEWEYLDEVAEQVAAADVVLSLGCGIGVQAMVEHFPDAWVVPGLNTSFLGLQPAGIVCSA
jgi:ferredoxin